MTKIKNTLNSKELSKIVANAMLEKKATDVVILDLRHTGQAVADFFVIGSGNTVNQVDAISDSIEELTFKFASEDPWRKEGKENKEWILLDYVNVVAHVFRKDRREFYGLENLWGDAKAIHVS
jgi:ribosome-associated protein